MGVLERHPFTAVSFSCIMTELLNGFHIFSKLCSVTDTVVHRCVCVCVWMRLYHTFNVLECHPFTAVCFFSVLWPICRLYTHKFSEFVFLSISHSFPMVGHF